MKADLILSRFPYHHGVYKSVKRCNLLKAIKLGWRVISAHEDGRVLMWLNSNQGEIHCVR